MAERDEEIQCTHFWISHQSSVLYQLPNNEFHNSKILTSFFLIHSLIIKL